MFDRLRDKLNVFTKLASETISMLGIVLVAAPLAVVIALVLGLFFSSASTGLIAFFIALAVLIVWLRNDEK